MAKERNKITDLQVIREYFNLEREEATLTAHQKDKLHRIRAAYGLLLGAHSNFFIVGTLMRTFKISQAQAYREIRDAETLFGAKKANKQIKRQIAEEMAKEAYRLAKAKGDQKTMVSAVRAYNEATGINIEDPDLPEFEKIQPSLIVTVLPEGVEKGILNLLEGGVVNLNKMPVEAQDIEHEEISSQSGRAD